MSNLNEFRLGPDDPRLTAYALGELEGEELAQVVASVAADPSLLAAVDEIRATASKLTAALNAEPLPAPVRPVHLEPYHTVRPARMFPFPYWVTAGLAAAACFGVFAIVRQMPFSNNVRPQVAGQLAENAGTATESARERIAGQQQASNHVEIRFPTSADDASAPSGGSADQWGVVLPNAPQSATDAIASLGSVGAAAAEKVVAASSAAAVVQAERRQAQVSAMAGAVLDHAFLPSEQNPLSSFPLDSGSSGYENLRRFLLDGRRPPRAVVRLEELVNYFTYNYTAPKPEDKEPLAASLEVASAPWEPLHRLVRIALKAREQPAGERAAIVARNVAIQVEFNPAQVQAYRLLGYENPKPGPENRAGDKSGAIDFESGHTVTAFYEIVPAVGNRIAETGDHTDKRADSSISGSPNPVLQGLLTVKIRYQAPDGAESRLFEVPLTDQGTAFADASRDFRFAAAVAEFGLVLRDSPYKSGATLADVLRWAEPATGLDLGGARSEFLSLVKRAEAILQSAG